jgi:hypothetical protein
MAYVVDGAVTMEKVLGLWSRVDMEPSGGCGLAPILIDLQNSFVNDFVNKNFFISYFGKIGTFWNKHCFHILQSISSINYMSQGP